MNKIPTLPPFGEVVPSQGGRLGAIMRGALVDGVRQPDYALIVPDVKAKAMAWGPYEEVPGANSLTDGLANNQAMLLAKCKPALHIQKIKVEGHTDFYLPARAELWALRANVPELFDTAGHWSSTQYSRYGAFVQGFEDGISNWYSKDDEFRVRPCRRIPLYHFPA